jgi:RNA 3'-terminal phosphate cyclase (ATP)
VIELDGSDGGGQLVRTALTLSALQGEPFRMERVRGNRSNPGLKRQHLACVEAVATLTDAAVDGDALGSETLVFEPTVDPGAAAAPTQIDIDIATAGSVTLVADTLLPLAVCVREPVTASLSGGTDVRWSPSADYLRRVKLPLLRDVGLDAVVDAERRGFYPAGGGKLGVEIRPSSLAPLELGGGESHELIGSRPGTAVANADDDAHTSVHAVAAAALEDEDIADRVADAAATEFDTRGIDPTVSTATAYAEADSPGIVLTVVSEAGTTPGGSDLTPRAGFVGYGDADASPASVADTTVEAVERWAETGAPVDAHLADQLVVWLALAGGSVPIPRVTDHIQTNVDLVRAFGYDVSIARRSGRLPTISATRI